MIYGRGTALTFLAGLVAGGVAALLLAPDKGTVTRRRIRGGARELRDEVETKAHDLKEAAQSRIEQVADAARSKMGDLRGAANDVGQTYRHESTAGEPNR